MSHLPLDYSPYNKHTTLPHSSLLGGGPTCLIGMALPLPTLSDLHSGALFSLSTSAPLRDWKRTRYRRTLQWYRRENTARTDAIMLCRGGGGYTQSRYKG